MRNTHPLYPAVTIARHAVRRIVYAMPFLRRMVEKKAPADPAYWDRVLAETDYIGNTVPSDVRAATFSAMIAHHAPANPAVLDIGCAGGDLVSFLGRRNFRKYLGVDLSAAAIKHGQSTYNDSRVRFVAADMSTFPIQAGEWDVILFNEVLYYSLTVDEAATQVVRYARELQPGGILCVSMKQDGKSSAIYAELEKRLEWVDGALYQPKEIRADFKTRISRERPAFLMGIMKTKDNPQVRYYGGRGVYAIKTTSHP